MQVSEACVNLIESDEGFKPYPYLCPAGVPTIGIGSTHYEDGTAVTLNDPPISHQDAVNLMMFKLNTEYAPAVDRFVKVPIGQNQFDALVDFAYNLGENALRTSTLLKLLNAKDYQGAAGEFGKWVHAEGKVLNGLVTRRAQEKALFEKDIQT